MENREPTQPTLPIAVVVANRAYRRQDVLPLLAQEGFLTCERDYDSDLLRLIAELGPRLVIMELGSGVGDEAAAVRLVVEQSNATVVVVVRAPGPDGVASLLECGAHGVLREADGPRALAAQLRRLISQKTSQAEAENSSRLKVQDLLIDFDRRAVIVAGRVVPLSRLEFEVLACLARNAGKVVSAGELYRAMHNEAGPGVEAQASVKTYIMRIRSKLGDDAHYPRYIVSVRSLGYLLERRSPESGAAHEQLNLSPLARDIAG